MKKHPDNADLDKMLEKIYKSDDSRIFDFSFDFDINEKCGVKNIDMEVINVKKTSFKKLSMIAFSVILLSVGAIFMCFNAPEKNLKKNTEKRIENYFFDKQEVVPPEEMLSVDVYQKIGDRIYMGGYIAGGTSAKNTALYDLTEKKKYELDLGQNNDGDDCEIQSHFIGDKYIFVKKVNKEKTLLILLDKQSLDTAYTTEIPENEFLIDIEEEENGDIKIFSYILDNSTTEISDVLYKTYSSDMTLKEQKELLDKSLLKNGTVCHSGLHSDDGSFYIFYRNGNNSVDMYKLSDKYETVYKAENINSDMDGMPGTVFISSENNPVLSVTQNTNGKNLYSFNEINSSDGSVYARYDTELSAFYIPTIGNITDRTSGYELIYMQNGKIYGYNLTEDEETVIIDIAAEKELGAKYSNSFAADIDSNMLIVSSYNTNELRTGNGISAFDKNGNRVFDTFVGQNNILKKISSDKDGNIFILNYLYDDSGNKWFIHKIDDSGKIIGNIPLSYSEDMSPYFDDFIIRQDGSFVISESGKIHFADKSGKIEKTTDIPNSYSIIFTHHQGDDYILYDDKSMTGVISRINYETKNIEKVHSLDVNIGVSSDVYSEGDENYDFYLTLSDGVYGYSFSDNSITEVINWVDSDISYPINRARVLDKDTVLVEYSEQHDYIYRIFERVDEETLSRIRQRKLITIGCDYATDSLTKLVCEYNKNNPDYKIKIFEYNKYRKYEDDKYINGTAKLNMELIKGDIPDIVFDNGNLDMNRYTSLGMFTDLSRYMENSENMVMSEYFENVIDMYKTDEKQYLIPLCVRLNVLVGKKSIIGDVSGLTMEDFVKETDASEVLYKPQRSLLMHYFILNNINEFVDFSGKTCGFENENFIDLLKYVEKAGIEDDDDLLQSVYESSDYKKRFEKNLCSYELRTISNFDDISYFMQTDIKEEVSFKGIPSGEGGTSTISSDYVVAISEKSPYKDAAWKFVETLLSDKGQYDMLSSFSGYCYSFPVKKSVFDDYAKIAMSRTENITTTDNNGKTIRLKNIDKTTVETLKAAVSGATEHTVYDTRIAQIIEEQTDIMFAGAQSAEEAAGNIQSKVMLYLKEIK